MGGKSSTSTSQVTVPPDVLARYNAVNAQAQATAATPFQQYTGQFVAPVNAQQDAGIAGINAGANLAQPYYAQASTDVTGAMNAAQPYYAGASTDVTGAQSIGNQLGAASLSDILGGGAAAAPWQNAAGGNYGQAYAGAQPYQIGATGLALAGGQAVNPYQITPQAINQFMSPYLQSVLGSTANVLNQNNQQQQAGQLGDAIRSGAFGGDRAGIGAANLEEQQNLANANIYSGIMNQGFNTALGAAQQQQGTYLGAGQANRAALQEAAGQLAGIGQQGFEQGMGLGSAQQGLGAQLFGQGMTQSQLLAALGQQQFGQGISAANTQAGIGQDVFGTGAATSQALSNIGTQAQQSALAGAQAQLGAGTLQQQTQQAQDTAMYNQFLQQQAYPFQVDQFLANIAEGTGALSGSTTTSTTPGGLFSDERLKEDIKPIGKTFDGQNIVQFRYKGDPTSRIGLIAQEVEKHHPGAVGQSQGFKTVDYGRATDVAAEKGHFRRGGLIPSNDNWREPRKAYAYGGYPSEPGIWPTDIAAILQSQASMYAPYSGGQTGVYGGAGQGLPRGGGSYVPSASLPVSHLAVSNYQPQQPNRLEQVKNISDIASNKAVDAGVQNAMGWLQGLLNKGPPSSSFGSVDPSTLDTLANAGLPSNPATVPDTDQSPRKRGGLVPRRRYDDGGDIPYDNSQDNGPYGPKLNIPNDNPKAQLAVAQPGKPGASPLSQISQMGNAAEGLGNMANMAGQGAGGLGALFGMAPGLGGGSVALGAGALGGGAALSAVPAALATAAVPTATAAVLPDLAALLPFMLAKGGSVRKGYDDGGDVQDDPMSDAILNALHSGAQIVAPAIFGSNAPNNLSDHLSGIPSVKAPIQPSDAEQRANVSALASGAMGSDPTLAYVAGLANDAAQSGRVAPPAPGSALGSATVGGNSGGFGMGNPGIQAALAQLAGRGASPAGRGSSGVPGPSGLIPSNNNSMSGIADAMDPSPAFVNPGPGNTGSGAALINPPVRTAAGLSPTDPLTGAGTQVTPPGLAPSNFHPGTPAQAQTLDKQLSAPSANSPSGNGLGGILGGLGKGIEGIAGNAVNWAHNNPAALMSILSGIGAMGAAQTKYPLIALSQGLGAAGNTYGQYKEQLANAQVEQAAAFKSLSPPPYGGPWTKVNDPGGGYHWVPSATLATLGGPSGAPAGGSGAAPGATGAPSYKYVGTEGQKLLDSYAKLGYGPGSADEAGYNQATLAASTAKNDLLNMDRMAQAYAQSNGTILQPGALEPLKVEIASKIDSALAGLPLPDEARQALSAQLKALPADQEMAKYANLAAFATSSQASGGQRISIQELQTALNSNPNPTQTTKALSDLIAARRANDLKDVDFANYTQEIGGGYTQPGAVSMPNARQAFNHDFSNDRYMGEEQKYSDILRSKGYLPLMAQLQSQDAPTRQKAVDWIDKNYGAGFHRWFVQGGDM